MTLVPLGRPQVVSLDSARPHVTAPCRCAACDYPWQAVVPAPAPRDGLECPKCASMTDAATYAKVFDALEVLDSLRAQVRTGKIVAFAAVGIEENDATRVWAASTADVSRLRMMGAISHLGHRYAHGETDTQ